MTDVDTYNDTNTATEISSALTGWSSRVHSYPAANGMNGAFLPNGVNGGFFSGGRRPIKVEQSEEGRDNNDNEETRRADDEEDPTLRDSGNDTLASLSNAISKTSLSYSGEGEHPPPSYKSRRVSIDASVASRRSSVSFQLSSATKVMNTERRKSNDSQSTTNRPPALNRQGSQLSMCSFHSAYTTMTKSTSENGN